MHRMQDLGRRDPVGSAVLTATARETRRLLSGGAVLLRPEEAVLETALGCWVMQMESRNLTAGYIEDSYRAVLRFRDHTNDYPWNWSAGDLEAWSSELLAGRQARTVRTLQNHIGRFLGYLLDPAYEWAAVCEHYFGTHPVQVCSEWNTIRQHGEGSSPGRARSRGLSSGTSSTTATPASSERAAPARRGRSPPPGTRRCSRRSTPGACAAASCAAWT